MSRPVMPPPQRPSTNVIYRSSLHTLISSTGPPSLITSSTCCCSLYIPFCPFSVLEASEVIRLSEKNGAVAFLTVLFSLILSALSVYHDGTGFQSRALDVSERQPLSAAIPGAFYTQWKNLKWWIFQKE